MKKIVLFHMIGCPHCEAMMPEWDKFEEENEDMIPMLKVESSTVRPGGSSPLVGKVVSFPTIAIVSDDSTLGPVFDGQRTAKEFKKFALDNMGMQPPAASKRRRMDAAGKKHKSRRSRGHIQRGRARATQKIRRTMKARKHKA